MANPAAWLFGSFDQWPDSDVTFGGEISGTETITAILTALYQDHATGSLSGRVQFVAAMTSAGGSVPFMRLLQNRRWEMGHAGGVFSVTWVDALVREFFGFTHGNLAGATSYIAASVSPYFHSFGRKDSPRMAPLGVIGQETADVLATAAPGGRLTVSKRQQSDFVNQFDFTHIDKSRYQTTEAGLAGEYALFHSTVLQRGWKFFLHRDVTEDDASTTPASIVLGNGLGPLVINPHKPGFKRRPFRREFVDVERSYRLSLHTAKTVEYTA